ncbi:MAG: DUF302 domain-containing protein [Sulfurimonadaceae bacterium]
MIYTLTTDQSLESVKAQIEERAKEAGFGVLKQYDFKTLLESKGFPIERDITVFELCNPSVAQEALTLHPEISVYLPCRISLYEQDGKTVLLTIGIEEMLGNFELEESFKTYMHQIFDRLKALIRSWE